MEEYHNSKIARQIELDSMFKIYVKQYPHYIRFDNRKNSSYYLEILNRLGLKNQKDYARFVRRFVYKNTEVEEIYYGFTKIEYLICFKMGLIQK